MKISSIIPDREVDQNTLYRNQTGTRLSINSPIRTASRNQGCGSKFQIKESSHCSGSKDENDTLRTTHEPKQSTRTKSRISKWTRNNTNLTIIANNRFERANFGQNRATTPSQNGRNKPSLIQNDGQLTLKDNKLEIYYNPSQYLKSQKFKEF